MNFALIGVGGYIAPRHLKAIKDTGNELVAAVDPGDSVGIIDSYFPGARFFTEIERFDRHIEKLRRGPEAGQVNYISICSPNYLHDSHVRLALRTHAHAICEKPLVINPWNLDALEELEAEYETNVYTILQLRLHEAAKSLKADLPAGSANERADVCLTYVTRRGAWYDVSWKGSEEKSGGVAMNIGIHFFDLLLWLFGEVHESSVQLREKRRLAGTLELERARVRWFLSLDEADLPDSARQIGQPAFRSLTIDGEELDFSTGFTNLHTEVYRRIFAGEGFRISDIRPSIELVHQVRTQDLTSPGDISHPLLSRGKVR